MEKRTWVKIAALMLIVVTALGVTACGSKTEEQEPMGTGPELSEKQMDDLYQQAADKTLEVRYADYMPDKVFGYAETFNIARDGDKGTWDTFLVTGEYAVVDSKAYLVAGSNGEAVLKFDYTNKGPKLNEVVWSADGSDHDDWVKENFSEEGYTNRENFLKGETAVDELNDILDQKAADGLGVPVEKDLMLQIDEDAGTYEIVKTTESGSADDGTYEFDTETVKKGKLDDLKKSNEAYEQKQLAMRRLINCV